MLFRSLLNAVTHKDYAGCTPIQIKVYADRIRIWNEGKLPENWTIDKLFHEHSSRPHNPDIANAFFRSGYVESWGRGIEKMTEQCSLAKLPIPIITNDGSDFWVVFRKDIYNKDDLSKIGLNEKQIKTLLHVKEKGRITNAEYQKLNDCSERTASRQISELVKANLLEQAGNFGAGSFYKLKTPE